MSRLVINGGKRLKGTVYISGSKNAALAIIPAALLSKGMSVIDNVPDIEDVNRMIDLLRRLGAKCVFRDNTLTIDSTGLTSYEAVCPECNCLRASSYLLGALGGRCHNAALGVTGGCDIGDRPLDYHVAAFAKMGMSVQINRDGIVLSGKPRGADIELPFPSVGATVNIMLAAVLADGITTINNAATEPHIVDAARFINAMGGMVTGAGTSKIRIKGKIKLKSTQYRIMPDQIEAGTYMIFAAITKGDIILKNINIQDMKVLTDILTEMGAQVTEYGENRDSMRVIVTERLKCVDITTAPYPEFPTDLQPLMTALLSVSEGRATVRENVFSNRLRFADYLTEMGAEIDTGDNTALINGVESLTCRNTCAQDLRGGAAMVAAGLAAEGCTVIDDAHIIQRGYEDLDGKVNALGGSAQYADIYLNEFILPENSNAFANDFN